MKFSKTHIATGTLLVSLIAFSIYASLKIKKDYCRQKQLEQNLQTLNDSLQILNNRIDSLNERIYDMALFELQHNPEAIDYLIEHYGKSSDWPQHIIDKLMDTNLTQGDNPLLPHAGMFGEMKINSVRVLNHKWLIVNFSDGKVWGEALMAYEPLGQDSITFETIRSLLYPYSH